MAHGGRRPVPPRVFRLVTAGRLMPHPVPHPGDHRPLPVSDVRASGKEFRSFPMAKCAGMNRPLIALTLGDPAGIGPEIVVRAVNDRHVRQACRPVAVGHPDYIERAFRLIGTPGRPDLAVIDATTATRDRLSEAADSGRLPVVAPVLSSDQANAVPRAVSAEAGRAAFSSVVLAVRLARKTVVDAIATAPLNKEALHAAGCRFPGHTEILAHECGVGQVAMMLHLSEERLEPLRRLVPAFGSHLPKSSAAGSLCGLSIVHVTLHTAIAQVPQQLTTERIVEAVSLMHDFLRRIGCSRRAIAVSALNPHGGENGLFGDEELRVIGPAVAACSESGWNVCGPLPADTLIRRAVGGEFDGVVAMYHDQGHIPVKLIGFDSATNITLGLPVIRTSPTHGTAFDRAWNADTPADASGMIEAVLTAVRLTAHGHPAGKPGP